MSESVKLMVLAGGSKQNTRYISYVNMTLQHFFPGALGDHTL